ncbi:MAG TPA: methionine adenosyltransferase [Leptospiraceae bacterium]|nr:methionine adenosyltransferase [Leptospirales bacterium]HMW60278.1 methionine adenosyltransferase [Leptospiraceae bacterium]HMX55581.1 methionine adenosyltransferase [Leptospiraceae bacterium]HMY45064.1 methionine adenosyltransferase [Leptospiraceae bacterium]HMZ35217.1 methionine adenosyltransferase [Leptospiraceae bacterium]
MFLKDFLFTSESVSEGHPDKICDQISDAVLDAHLAQDPASRVACESLVTTDFVCVAGEITSNAKVDVEALARKVINKIGYTTNDIGFCADTAQVMVRLHSQSPDISMGVTEGEGLYKEQGAGDQGLMFGFANDETPELMPLPISLAHRLMKKLADLRHSGEFKDILPDSKSQVTVEYRDGKPSRIDTVVISTQHREHLEHKVLTEMLVEQVIKKVIPANYLTNTRYLINPTGKFVVGGPHGDCGLTGRKIIVDTYGGYGRHGGGAFSGKDPTKVDRSAAYMARYVAKNVVAAGLCTKCEVQVSYAIGFPQPTSILVDSFGTGKIPDEKIAERVKSVFNFSPGAIEKLLKLRDKGRTYLDTAAYGHFGRDGETFTWEKTDKAEALK